MEVDLKEKLNALQCKKFISPEVLANILGYRSRQSIYALFSGKKKNLEPEKLNKLAIAYGVSITYFYDEIRPSGLYKPSIRLSSIENNAEKLSLMITENHQLWIENSLLKSRIIELENDLKKFSI